MTESREPEPVLLRAARLFIGNAEARWVALEEDPDALSLCDNFTMLDLAAAYVAAVDEAAKARTVSAGLGEVIRDVRGELARKEAELARVRRERDSAVTDYFCLMYSRGWCLEASVSLAMRSVKEPREAQANLADTLAAHDAAQESSS
jgi:hypothetical protein